MPTSFIDPEKVVSAAQYYKDKGHPQYQSIEIEENYSPQITVDELDPVPGLDCSNPSQEATSSDNHERRNEQELEHNQKQNEYEYFISAYIKQTLS